MNKLLSLLDYRLTGNYYLVINSEQASLAWTGDYRDLGCPAFATNLFLSLRWDELSVLNLASFLSGLGFSASPRTGLRPRGDLSHAEKIPVCIRKPTHAAKPRHGGSRDLQVPEHRA
jgi:hypothetical protein